MDRTTDWRLGAGKYGQKFRYVIATDQPPDQVLAAAEADMKSTREEMFQIASQLNGVTAIPATSMGRSSARWIRSQPGTRLRKRTSPMRAVT